jgi:hypothetical protein
VGPPDIERINDLTRRLDDICREAQTIRAEIRAMALVAPSWPDIEEISRHSRGAGPASDFFPPDRPSSDTK